MALLFTNNASTTLSSGCAPTDGSLVLAAGTGALFPSPNPINSDYFYATLQTAAGALEIVKVAGRSGDTLTSVTRGVDGTTAQTFASGTVVEQRVVSQTLRDINAWQAQLGANNGIATLNSTGQIPAGQLSATILESVLGTSYYIPQSEAGVASGVATLDGSAHVVMSQLGGLLAAANTWTGSQTFATTSFITINQNYTGGMATSSGTLANLAVTGPVGGAAFMSFNRQSAFACYFGLDSDSTLRVGGWSFGNNSYRIIHEGITTANLTNLTLSGTLNVNSTVTLGGSINGAVNITASGTITASAVTAATITDTSDRSIKDNPVALSLDRARDIVLNHEAYTFYNRQTGRLDFGTIADCMLDTAPELVFEKGGLMSVAYQRMVSPLAVVAKDHEARIARLERLAGAIA